MPEPARKQWWDDVVSVDTHKLNDNVWLLWGDRVRVLDRNPTAGRVKIHARNAVGWVPESVLGGQPLLELYVIDVGQGDGMLVVTPEGHHLMVDGGLQRSRQQTGKSAADFVDWKFHKDYLPRAERADPASNRIFLDAMIASHADADHYGGLRDLIDPAIELKADELDTQETTVEAFYHPGLCPQREGTDGLGDKIDGHFVSLLDDRDSAQQGLSGTPGTAPDLRGWWRDFIAAVLDTRTAAGSPTPMQRLSQRSGFLPGFSPTDTSSEVVIRVLAPIERSISSRPGLKDLGNEGQNKNGHSVALRVEYGDRSLLLTGDLNERAQREIMDHYDRDFEDSWKADVAKACHHGSHHVDYEFLRGINALSTVFSSGDANSYDHPRAWVLGAAALSGRVIPDKARGRLKAPLIYSTEVARSLALRRIEQLREYDQPQQYGRPASAPVQLVSGEVTTQKWRAVLDRDSGQGRDQPPVPDARVMRALVYGLVNVRSDGKRLLFAVRNEGNSSWAFETMEDDEISRAQVMKAT